MVSRREKLATLCEMAYEEGWFNFHALDNWFELVAPHWSDSDRARFARELPDAIQAEGLRALSAGP